jgi:hypothetical protein
MTTSCCQVCDKMCTTRCSRCQVVFYCSVACQRMDWSKTHSKICRGNNHKTVSNSNSINQEKKRKKDQQHDQQQEYSLTSSHKVMGMGPLPDKLRNDQDVQHALQELLSLVEVEKESETKKSWNNYKKNHKEKKEPTASSKYSSSVSLRKGATNKVKNTLSEETIDDDKPSTSSSSSVRRTPPYRHYDYDDSYDCMLDDSSNNIQSSYLVEDMSQISCYRLTLKVKHNKNNDNDNLVISVQQPQKQPLKTVNVNTVPFHSNHCSLVIIRQQQQPITTTTINSMDTNNTKLVFVGEFPKVLQQDRITWQMELEKEKDDNTNNTLLVYSISLPYHCREMNFMFPSHNTTTTAINTTLYDINMAGCANCHLPLVSDPMEEQEIQQHPDKDDTLKELKQRTMMIQQVLPLPQVYWEDIAEYLMCYSGVSKKTFVSYHWLG